MMGKSWFRALNINKHVSSISSKQLCPVSESTSVVKDWTGSIMLKISEQVCSVIETAIRLVYHLSSIVTILCIRF